MIDTIIQGNNQETLKNIPENSVDCVVTSPPYFGLRDYGTANWEGGDENCKHMRDNKHPSNTLGYGKTDIAVGDSIFKDICRKCGAKRIDQQIGLENTPEEYVKKLCDLFDDVKRVLKPEGTCFVNLGDTYGGSGNGTQKNITECSGKQIYRLPSEALVKNRNDKCLLQIPSRFSIEMTNRGWILRNKIIWYKRNAMPQSVQDRFTVDFEEFLFFVRSKKYYFDQESIKEPCISTDQSFRNRDETRLNNTPGRTKMAGLKHNNYTMRNKRCVWDIPTKPYKEAHFAVFPETLLETPIKAGCPKNGVVLDPFMGSGTTAIVALKNDRHFIGCELNPEYIKIAEERIAKYKRDKVPKIKFKDKTC